MSADDTRFHSAGCRDLILVMEPATILGALLGSYVNKVCNNVLTPSACSPLHIAVYAFAPRLHTE